MLIHNDMGQDVTRKLKTSSLAFHSIRGNDTPLKFGAKLLLNLTSSIRNSGVLYFQKNL